MNINEIEEKIKIMLVNELSPKLIYIFGSIVANRVRDDSDIDIAILTEKKIDEYQLYMVSQQLADKLKREVDIVDLKDASTIFKAEIIKNGKLIYNSDNLGKMYYQLEVLREYTFLNERRQEIIDKLKKKVAKYD
ncbi:MAG TPA: nucleotidyltransferase domain-containing protein [Atribacterota bacterium]|nr:nucleotidyltransferase domain-containing protein [Atribacterota bacterium]